MSALTDREKARIIELRNQGKHYKQISKSVGRSISVVHGVVAEHEGREKVPRVYAPKPTKPPSWQAKCRRCPECGRKVLLPCKACSDEARKAQAKLDRKADQERTRGHQNATRPLCKSSYAPDSREVDKARNRELRAIRCDLDAGRLSFEQYQAQFRLIVSIYGPPSREAV